MGDEVILQREMVQKENKMAMKHHETTGSWMDFWHREEPKDWKIPAG